MLRETDERSCGEAAPRADILPGYVRAEGVLRCTFLRQPRGTEANELRESGGYRMRFPRVPAAPDATCEAVMINTGGGMTGGDRLSVELRLGEAASVTATTQSAEKLYRSQGAASRLDIRLDLAARAQLAWLPQEQILFSGSRLQRRSNATWPPMRP